MSGASPASGEPLVVIGEVRTALLMNLRPLPPQAVVTLLDFVPGERVMARERPVRRAVSADVLHGVDCPLTTGSGARVRGIGTLLTRAGVLDGRVVQGSTRAVLATGGERRLPWGHYLERPGVVELSGRGAPADVAHRFLTGRDPADLDPGAVSEALLGRIRSAPSLDRRTPLRARRTRLRWASVLAGDGFRGEFSLVDQELRTLRLGFAATTAATPGQLATLCEDIALHDWLLSTVTPVVDRACSGHDSVRATGELRTVVDQLLHLWLPNVGGPSRLDAVWAHLEAHPGFSRQWGTCVQRVRDHLALRALDLRAGAAGGL
ncbi:SCO2521 family protein [Streptomyces sp. NPDC089424]|uniref:SCO2521 family protein n=1 Tax=Streptomyces sp. NPDC089424 TaxID=3365917 RepID=UPI0038200EB5